MNSCPNPFFLRMLFAAGATALCACPLTAQRGEFPPYTPAQQATDIIHTCGSPQMGDLLRLYEEGFHQVQPNVGFVDDLKSTLTTVAGVYTGHADIGLLGREIWPNEVQAFRSAEGRPPIVIEVATGSFDVPKATFALMIFVPKENPIASLSIVQLETIFGETAGTKQIRTWGDLGLAGPWASRPVHLYGFGIDNDKSQIFSQLVFRKGERWNKSLHEFSNAANGTDAGQLIINAVATDPDAIGISNVHYATPSVKALALSTDAHPEPIVPTRETVANTTYPLTRAVYMVLNNDAAHPLSDTVREFLRYVLSRQGQIAVEKEGNYLPLTSANASVQLRMIDSPPQEK
jgi:phosphate transport system substrate-binding protein